MNMLKNKKGILILLLVAGLSGSVLAVRQVDRLHGGEATLDEILYIRSPKILKRISLGYSGLLADIYWTRTVQYYGNKLHHGALRYDLLYPMLDITTDLDPHLLPAYEYGSIFLSQPPPAGAGQPDEAARLVEKGIKANPNAWRLYFTLGFIHYLDRKDYKAASDAFNRGSEATGAPPGMKAMAAAMAQHAGEPAIAMALWRALYETTQDNSIRETALKYIASLQADQEMAQLEHSNELYRQKTGRLPTTWKDLIDAGLLRQSPRDPTGNPYRLMPDGTVSAQENKQMPFITHGVPASRVRPR